MGVVTPRGSGARGRHAALRLLDAPGHALPTPLTSFLGRTGELDALGARLHDTRLLTLVGPGGVGKTRLAIEAAGSFEADAVFVNLAAVDADDNVLGAIATAVGARETAHRSLLEAVAATIKDRSLLVVLDNCEHVVAAAAANVAALLAACPYLVVLATSRELLNCDGEVVFRVAPLPTETAAALFVERARTHTEAEPVPADAPDVIAAICDQLDGLPLAIELAAARTRLLTLRQIQAGLDDQMELLSAGRRTAADRHRSASASVEWSYALLDATEQRVLAIASVFLGGFSMEAVQAVCAAEGITPATVLATVGQLVDKSLVTTDLRGDGRLGMLETIRQFAFEQLADPDHILERHARHFASTLAWRGEAERAYHARVDTEFANAERAMQTAVRTRDIGLATALARALAWYWATERHAGDGLRFCNAFLEFVASDDDRIFVKALRCRLAYTTGAWDVAIAEAHEVEAAIPQLHSPQDRVFATLLITYMVDIGGRLPATLQAAYEVAVTHGMEHERLELLSYTKWIQARESGDFTGVSEALAEVEAKSEALGLASTWLYARQRQALLLVWRGNLGVAREALEVAVEESRRFGAVLAEAEGLGVTAGVQVLTGFEREADATLARLAALAEEVGLIGVFQATMGQVTVRFARGEWRELEAVITPMAAAFEGGGTLWTASIAWRAIARVNLGDLDGAQADLDLIGDVCTNAFSAGFQLLAIALVALARDGAVGAEATVLDGLPLIRPEGTLGFVAAAYAAITAHVLQARGRQDDAVRCHSLSLRLAADTGASWDSGIMRSIPVADADALTTALGQSRFDALAAEGAAMSFDEMAGYLQRGRGRRNRPLSGWDALTPTEQQVVDLVVEGATNAEIAAKLFMSVPTVKSHLTHVYAKVTVRNRAELTAAAARR